MTCPVTPRHAINPQAYLTRLLANLPDTPISQLDERLPDQWKQRQEQAVAPPTPTDSDPESTLPQP